MARWPEILRQFVGRLRDVPRTSLVLWTAAACLLIAGLAWAWQFRPREQLAELFGGRTFTSRELTTIEAAFAKARLNGYKIDNRRVRIPQNARSSYISALVDNDALPVDLSLSDRQLTANPFETASQRQARNARTRERQLSAIIRSLNGIDDAAVHLDEEIHRGLHRRREVTAIVAVRPTAGHTLDAARVHHIQNIVAGSRIGLTTEGVTVADLDTGTSYPLESDRSVARLAGPRRRYEQYLTEQIECVLGFIPDVQVATMAEMHWSVSSDGSHDKRPEIAANSLGSLTPRGVSITVAVPTTYFLAAWRRGRSVDGESRTPTATELAKTEAVTQQRIAEAVRGALPERLLATPGAVKIMVTSLEPATPDGRLAVARAMTRQQNTPLLPQSWISALVGLVAIAALVGSLVFGASATESEVSDRDAPLSTASGRASPEFVSTSGDSTVAASHPARSVEPTCEEGVRQSLVSAVQDDPHAAAEVLRRWMGKAA